MIAYFPQVYPDELFYSIASRFYVGNGYLSCSQMVRNFYDGKSRMPEYQFINRVNQEVIEHLCRDTVFEDFLQKHTMLCCYGRFMTEEKRKIAYTALQNMDGNYGMIFPVGQGAIHLKYCTVCTAEDRKRYGETYWHTMHQIPELAVCPIHGCRLIESEVIKNKIQTSNYTPAEMVVSDVPVQYGSQREQELASYLYQIIQSKFNLSDGINAGKYISCCLYGTKYSTSRGKTINASLLADDVAAYYSEMNVGVKKVWQIHKMLNGRRTNTFEIAQVGNFLGIPPEELVVAKLPDKLPEQIFEEKVLQMLNEGMSIYNISVKMKTSQEAVNAVAKSHGKRSVQRSEQYLKAKQRADAQKIERYRELWLKALQEYPGCSMGEILKNKAYRVPLRWLRRKDKEWTDEHYPRKR